MDLIKKQIQKFFRVKTLKKRVPICDWLPKYTVEEAIGDSIAGLTVGLTLMPQAIAYAFLAGLTANYGLYSAFVGCLIYVLLGTCKEMSVGPAAVISILTYEYAGGDPELAALLSFTTGIIVLLCTFLNLGFLISFVSKPVLSGFISAAAITIISSQLKGLFGLKIHPHGVVDTWTTVVNHLGETKWPDAVLGFSSIVILLLIKKIGELERFKSILDDTFKEKILKRTVFLIYVGRNAIVIITATIVATSLGDDQPFSIAGNIKPGLPTVQAPPFSTNNGATSFLEMMSKAGAGVIVLPLVAILENITVASAFAKGKAIDATQEMFTLGLCNLIGSFFQAYPSAGSFSRAAVNSQSGVRTTAGGTVTAIMVILALAVLTPYFTFIPLASLAAVLICAVLFIIEYHDIVPIWKVRKVDELILWTTFLASVFWKVEYGLLLGVIINVLVLLYNVASPKVEVTTVLMKDDVPPHVIITPRSGLIFVNIEHVRARILKAAQKIAKGTFPVIIDCTSFSVVDYSASFGMRALCKEFESRSQPLLFMNASPGCQRGLLALNSNVHIIFQKDSLVDTLKQIQKVSISVVSSKEPIATKFTNGTFLSEDWTQLFRRLSTEPGSSNGN